MLRKIQPPRHLILGHSLSANNFRMATVIELLVIAKNLLAEGRHAEAEQICVQIINVAPQKASAWLLLGVIACQTNDDIRAFEYLQRAVQFDPTSSDAFYNLGVLFQKQGKNSLATGYFRRAIKLNPSHFQAHINLGASYQEQLRFDEAEATYEQALQIMPDSPEAHSNFAVLKLAKGNLLDGWNEYEWRWQTGQLRPHASESPLWQGEPLSGKTLLIHSEQGFGDTFQFIRYLPLVKNLGAKVIFECQKPLLKLLTTALWFDELIAAGSPLPSHDFRCPLLSLPRILKTTLSTIPCQVPYLSADPELTERWNTQLRTENGYLIGINWHGRVGLAESKLRDIPTSEFERFTELAGAKLISLQKEPEKISDGESTVAETQEKFMTLGDFDSTAGAFMDTAAIMKNLDLIITSDTSIPHLAGALGVPVWVALPFVPDWRWLLDRSDSPWYLTMRLFRQKSPGDWSTVFTEIRTALAQQLEKIQPTPDS